MATPRNVGPGTEAEFPEYAGHYRLESCLGSGGMGVVHLARSTSGLKLAVKVVHAEFAKDPEFRGRFRQEVAAARRVSGAFTAPVVDADPDAERPWMATLFIPGPTLSEQVKRNGPLDPAQVRRLMAGLAEALRDIHRVGVVHRDLKPSNVLLAEDGPKVIDFGISRPKDSELRTETGKLIGTPPFMAPEQFRRPREVGPAADIFALGSVLVHAATGRGPFDSDSPYVVAYQVVHDEPDLTGVPEELASLVLRCLAKEPEERPTPDELMRELRSEAASYDTQAFIPAQRTEPDRGVEAGPAQDRDRDQDQGRGQDRVQAPEAVREPGGGAKAPAGVAARRVRRGPGRRAVLGAAALVAAVAAVLVTLRSADGGAAPEGNPRAVAAGFDAWEAEPAGGEGVPQCTYGAKTLVCARTGLVFALDPADGRSLWRHPVAPLLRGTPPAVSAGLVQPALDHGPGLEALDPASGAVRWRKDGLAYSGSTATGAMLLLTRADGTVSGVDAATGEVRWNRPFPGRPVPHFRFFGGRAAYAATVAADGGSTRVTAVDPATGNVRWDKELPGTLDLLGAAGGSVYLAEGDSVYGRVKGVVRYTPDTGATRRVALPVPVDEAQGGVYGSEVYLMGGGGSLVAVDMAAGRQRWRLETGIARGSAPVADGRHVYVTGPDGRLLGVDARKGRLLGQTPPRLGAGDGVPAGLPAPVVADGRVYAGAPDGTVFAVDGRDPASW
ncbi:PQQ-binding-like beta-propeller repeat protein [Streptomyces sp. TRM S81-3]|uniref:PQQ-binding-like beta-propeller repeat protein n=1 Tax=Streptomyces griseicoloratus TaxID=2752516 RepID=A0A926L990_9ACTN|nr:serine/threonine-protein kinase [Streptomyces griseicoloratus]MBD0422502.1 PQQ-binding-like beta-propeller repeat protein [Streptomyces griseicoloratus]